MSGHADTIRRYITTEAFMPQLERERAEAVALTALDALMAENVEQADRIAWLEGDVAGWRIKLAECEERHE